VRLYNWELGLEVGCHCLNLHYTSPQEKVAAMKYSKISHVESGRTLVSRAFWCDDFVSKLRGFTFRRRLDLDDGLVLVESSDGRVNTAIHMLFVFFDLGVIWVNGGGEVVDTKIAKAWRTFHAPKAAARYVVEVHPNLLNQVRVGEHLQFDWIE
jgi:uncharacterized membrane protein (UPF0127 family)